jgi:hypothetical protein
MSNSRFLSRGIDYLGDLGAKLRDLQGYRTLAHELIQNADDAPAATSMSFDVRDDALVADNDGVFTDCGQIEKSECPWKEDGTHDHRCDFHRFRHVASGDKRGEAGTTGAFGIGFTAVYQVTDRPELISAGQHWMLQEDRPEDQRIEVCPGCPTCTQSTIPGTRFILPWARAPQSDLRQALRADAVPVDGPNRMREELEHAMPVAMLFLKRLRTIDIKRNGQRIRTFQRVDDNDSLILSDGQPENDRIWHIVRGDFTEAAEQLREQHPGRIENKRSSQVTLAVSATELRDGLLCACLPTEQDVGLPFHVNADFFPTNDRKRVILGDDYQSYWNSQALNAAACAIGQAIGRFPILLGAQRFWDLVSTIKEVADKAVKGVGEPALAEFWRAVAPHLRTAPVVYTTRSEWTICTDASLLLQREEASAILILEGLGVNVVHEDLRPYQNLLRAEAVGVPVLDIERLCAALASYGLDRRIELSALPSCLDSASGREALWREIALLLERQQRTPKAKADDELRLREIALAPGRDNALWPCRETFSADKATVDLFESLSLGIPFVSSVGAFAPLLSLCPPFDAAAAIDVLRGVDSNELERKWQQNRLPLRGLFEWFENRRQQIFADEGIRQKLAALSLYPSSGKLRSIEELALSGNFDDHLGLTELVDLAALGGRREFLRDLGMPELDFRTYAVARLPAALNEGATTVDKRRAAIELLASRAGELRDDQEARRALATTRLVECTDGEFRQAQECYFDMRAVRDCLGDNTHFATLPKGHEAAVHDFYAWLGVSSEPALQDLVKAIHVVVDQAYSPAGVMRIQTILAHLGTRVEAGEDSVELKFLQNAKWLPAQGKIDRWYSPTELHAVYSKHLFESQALFLDVPVNVQNSSGDLLKYLGVRLTPAVGLVVKHLIQSATLQIPVNKEVYRFLNDNVADPTLGQLKGQKCLWLGEAYYAPTQVFWGDHPFGPYRRRLREELRGYSNLLKRLEVRDTPDHQDAQNVLIEISSEFGSVNTPLDDDAYVVLMACWQMLERALDGGSVSTDKLETLRSVKCIPNAVRVLNPPEWMFFENRAGLAAKFEEYLAKNVIPRPLGAGNAFAAAGVQQLGSTVEVVLLECADPTEDADMTQRILARRNEIGRVLVSQSFGSVAAEGLGRLASIRCQATTSLAICYRLRAFNRQLLSKAEPVPALYQREQGTLFFTRTDGRTPWGAIAREVAIALFPVEDPGRFAAGFKEVLAPDSVAEAAAVLDELGFARLDTAVHEAPSTGEAAGILGTDTPPSELVLTDPAPGGATPTEPGGLTREEALKRLLGADAPPPTPPVPETDNEPLGSGGRSGSGKTESGKKKGRPVLRSYLPSPDGADSGPADRDDEADGQSRSPVDEAGVRRALAYETACKRIPTEMPHKNPGYDIESRDAFGNVVRYIEVKSFSGQWSNTYAVLSRPQFDKATGLGDAFWLYVVECAETDDFSIHRIPNPALKANHFMFDDGWRSTAEPAPPSEEGK